MPLILRDAFTPSDKAAVRLAARLAVRGAKIEGSGYYAPWVPHCDSPVIVVLRSHPRSALRTVEAGLLVPCRKCAKCRQFRQMRWRQRIFNEIAQCDDMGRRTWFGTLTFSEIHLAALFMQGKATAALRGIPLAEAVERHAYAEVKLYHKRLRKRLGAKRGYRFVAVAEYGEENGRLHYHILVHELGAPITYRDLLAAWRSGFMHAKLVQCDATSSMSGIAGYVSKYIAKSLTSAVRASTQYGKVSQT